MLEVYRIINHPVTSNCFVLFRKKNSDCIVIDPGTKDNKGLTGYLLKEGLIPKYIILTHEHFDHCWGVNQLVEKYHIPILCSARCADAIKNEKRNCSVFYDNMEGFTIKSKTIIVESINNILDFNGYRLKFFNTPGHTDASISFVVGKYLFTGDTLIKGEKTVTKLPTGSVEKLKKSLQLYSSMKGKGFCVCSGHGDEFMLDGYELAKVSKREADINSLI